MTFTANVRFKLRISQNRKRAAKNRPKQLLWTRLTWSYSFWGRSNEQWSTSQEKTWSQDTDSRLPFAVSVTLNLSIVFKLKKKIICCQWDHVHTYPNTFWKRRFFPPILKKYASKGSVIRIVFARPHLFAVYMKTLMRWIIRRTIPYRTRVMLVVYDVNWFTRTRVAGGRFRKSLLRRAFLNRCVFGDRFHRRREDSRPKYAVQKYPDLCGRDLSVVVVARTRLWLASYFADVSYLGCVQTGATTPNIVAPMLRQQCWEVCKRMRQLPASLGPAEQCGRNTTHKSL